MNWATGASDRSDGSLNRPCELQENNLMAVEETLNYKFEGTYYVYIGRGQPLGQW